MSDDLIKRLRELRNNQYADPSTAPEFVFLDPDLPPSEWQKQYNMDVVYVRADLIKELEESNKELTLQLLATSGQAADALDKLAKAMQYIRAIARQTYGSQMDYHEHNLADFEGGHDLIIADARTTLAELEK
jgi:hypothetical protein